MGKTLLANHVNQWIDLSRSDLQSSRILYLAGKHHNSYFLFQQAVEKANKAFALYIGFTEKELKAISHDQMKIYKAVLKTKKNEVQDLIIALDKFPNIQNHQLFKPFNLHEYHSELLSSITMLQNLKNSDLINISASDINYLLNQIDELEYAEIDLPKYDETTFRTLLSNVSDLLGQLEIKNGEISQKELDIAFQDEDNVIAMRKYLEHGFKLVHTIAIIESTFVIAAFLTIQHSSKTRYIEGEHNPLKVYTKKLAVVKKQEEIMDFLERALRKFKQVVSRDKDNASFYRAAH